MAGRPTDGDRRSAEMRRAIGGDIRRLRQDAGITTARLAAEAGISRSHLAGIESGRARASTEALGRVAHGLGADLSLRLYPGTGPRIRDHIQSAIADELVRTAHPRWRRHAEVAVYRPVRGVIDLVLHDPEPALVVGIEIHSELRRLEQLLRWASQKREALPSADLWSFVTAGAGAPAGAAVSGPAGAGVSGPAGAGVGSAVTTSGLLIVRSTERARAIVDEYAHLLALGFPARARDIVASLVGGAPWPGAGVAWAVVDRGAAKILDGPPRGVAFGR